MLFTSPIFIFYFMPLVLILQWVVPSILRNLIILAASLFFYFYGEGWLVLFLFLSFTANYLLGLLLDRYADVNRFGYILLWIGIIFNVGLLAYFKYANFFVIEILSVDTGRWKNIALPIGISFYTFQCISYIIDVYRRSTVATKNYITFGTYISCFPQLIAGPIVRYKDIKLYLHNRSCSLDNFYSGTVRFITGFGKKMLIANPMGWIADQIYGMPPQCIDAPHAWLGMISYTLQIYYDFSGYSDMAIGLGLLLGFHFPENFNFPYIASSIQDFWRRWHMTLTAWLKDYIYIPMGGSRKGQIRSIFNKWTVFILCGFWHGANWTFLAWGIWHGFFITLEGILGKILPVKFPVWIKHLWTLGIIIFGWVIFRSENMPQAVAIMRAAIGLNNPEPWAYTITRFIRADLILIMLAGVFFSMPVAGFTKNHIPAKYASICFIGHSIALVVIFILSTSWAISSNFNPFLYFRF